MLILLGFVLFFVLTGAAYVVLTLLVVPGLAEERLGRLEELPEHAEHWRVQEMGDQSTPHLRCESRFWIDHNLFGLERIVHQVRYVDRRTGEVVKTDPDRRVRRRRVRA